MSDKSYQELSSELDSVLAELQDPNVQVDEAVTLYDRGTKLIAQLENRLKQTESKLTKLKKGK